MSTEHHKKTLDEIAARSLDWQSRVTTAYVETPTANTDPPAYVAQGFTMAELVANPPGPISWRVDGLVQRFGITGLIARPKAGKSFLLQHTQACITAGIDILGKSTMPGRVLYLDEEMGKEALYSRWLAMRGADPSFSDPANLERFNVVCLGGMSIDRPDRVRAEIDKAEPDVLVVDSFRRVFHGDENASKEVARAMQFFSDLRSEYRFDIIISHHTRKNLEGSGSTFWEDAARGSGDFFAACDGLLGLGRRGKDLAELRGTLRNRPDLDPISLEFDPVSQIWKPTTKTLPAELDVKKLVEEIVRSKPDRRCDQRTAHLEMLDGGATEKQAEKILARIPVVDDEAFEPPAAPIWKRPQGRSYLIFAREKE